MRYFILILVFCFQGVSQTLVQSTIVGTASSSSNPTSLATPAGGFVSNTQPKSLIVAVTYATITATSGDSGSGGNGIGVAGDSTHGFSFSSISSPADWLGGPPTAHIRQGHINIRSQISTVSIPNTATTASTCSFSHSPFVTAWSATCELHLYEFSVTGGMAFSGLDGSNVNQTQAVGTPFSGLTKTTTNADDLIIAVYSADPATASFATAGSGYTIGLDTTVAGIGQLQWQYVTSTSTYSLAFSGASSNDGIGQAVAFKQIASSTGSVQRHRGVVF